MLFAGLRARSRAARLIDANARLLALAAGSPALAMIVRADGRIELSIALANLFGFDTVPAHFSDLIDNDSVLAPEDAQVLGQEVSAAQTTQTGVSSFPTIATRKVETRLTLEHGATVLLGGLISSDRSDGDGGVPGLKDIPLLGNLFKRQTRKDTRRELIVLITPYIISDGQEAAQITEAFRNALPLLNRPQAGTAPAATPAPSPAPVQQPAR